MQTTSSVQFHGLATVGDRDMTRAQIVANDKPKSHRFVDLACLIVTNGKRPIAHIRQTVNYRLRHLAT